MPFNFVRIRSVGVSGFKNLPIEAHNAFQFQLDSETDQGRAQVVHQWVADGAEEGPTCCMHRRRPSQTLRGRPSRLQVDRGVIRHRIYALVPVPPQGRPWEMSGCSNGGQAYWGLWSARCRNTSNIWRLCHNRRDCLHVVDSVRVRAGRRVHSDSHRKHCTMWQVQKTFTDERVRGSAGRGDSGQPARSRRGLSRVPIVPELPQDMRGLLGGLALMRVREVRPWQVPCEVRELRHRSRAREGRTF